MFARWPVYAVAVGGIAGVLLEQAALQEGPLRASQPPLVIVDPMVSIVLSVFLFAEAFAVDAGGLAAATAGFCVMCAGAAVLSVAAPDTVAADADLTRPR